LLSWKEDLLQRVRELGADADGYLRKEATASVVLSRVREVLRARARVESRLAQAGDASRRLDLFEAALAARLAGLRRPSSPIGPRILHALLAFDAGRPVAAVARDLDLSHRHFTQLFRSAVGLTPKCWGRLRRFGRALDRLAAEPEIAWADLAAAEGYADQPHFTREFRAFAGLAPGDYRRRAPLNARHVPL